MGTVEVVFHFRTAMKKLIVPCLLVFIPCALFMNGCDLAQPLNTEEQPVVQNAPPQENVPPVEAPPQQQESPNDEDNTVTVKAEVGLGARGHYGTPTGNNPMEIVTVPISTLFRTQERLVLQQVEHAMNLYKAEHGRGPASHAEFMDQIIRANNLRLPQLPPNQEYVFDPRDGELKVRKPRNAP